MSEESSKNSGDNGCLPIVGLIVGLLVTVAIVSSIIEWASIIGGIVVGIVAVIIIGKSTEGTENAAGIFLGI